MTSFQDGPAHGVTLYIRRAPIFLRVVLAPDGTWDALDQIGDTPDARETIHVYVLTKSPGWMHLNRRDPKTRRQTGGMFAMADYRWLPDQPEDATMRSEDAWKTWTCDTYRRLKNDPECHPSIPSPTIRAATA